MHSISGHIIMEKKCGWVAGVDEFKKLLMDGCTFQTETDSQNHRFRITLTKCPWYDLMVKSGREHLAEKVGSRICTTEYSTWAQEFGEDISFEIKSQICNGSECCVLQFSQE